MNSQDLRLHTWNLHKVKLGNQSKHGWDELQTTTFKRELLAFDGCHIDMTPEWTVLALVDWSYTNAHINMRWTLGFTYEVGNKLS